MSPSESGHRKSNPVVVVALGKDARAVCDELIAAAPGIVVGAGSPTADSPDAATVVEVLRGMRPVDQEPTAVPAVLIAAATVDAEAVLAMLVELRSLEQEIRPRVWPTFVAGDPAELEAFDVAMDTTGSGLCDLALVTIGSPSAAATASALGAWVQIKAPAPASVLGELPDSHGRTCRYVALGAEVVSADKTASTSAGQPDETSAADTAAADAAADAAAVKAVVQDLRAEAAGSDVIAQARTAATAIGAAGEQADTAAVLRADKDLTGALDRFRTQVADSLRGKLDEFIATALASAAPLAEASADAEPPATATAKPDVDRSEAIAALVMLTSKGGLAKMFSRSRTAGAAQSAAGAANADIDVQLERVIADLAANLPAQVAAARSAEAERERAQQEELARSQQTEDALRLEASVGAASLAASVWPKVDATGIRRSWGGSVPAARRYVVKTGEPGDGSIPGDVSDANGTLTIIDLRDPAPASESDRPAAVVLVAQYGLPLSALSA